jgi:hypothetical protein
MAKKLTTGAKKAIKKGEDLGVKISNKTGDTFGGGAVEKPAGRANVYGYGVNGPNVPVKGSVRKLKKNMNSAINTSAKKSPKKSLG